MLTVLNLNQRPWRSRGQHSVVARMGFWPLRKSQDENFGIEAGQRYRSAATPSMLWEVAAITRYPWDATPHVRLQRVGAPQDAKTISLMVLKNGRFFLPAN